MGHGAFMWRVCEGKRPYTEEEARRVAGERNARLTRRQTHYTAYFCTVCGDGETNWHIGRRKRGGHKMRSGAA